MKIDERLITKTSKQVRDKETGKLIFMYWTNRSKWFMRTFSTHSVKFTANRLRQIADKLDELNQKEP